MELPVFTSFGLRSRVIFCSCSTNPTLLFHKCFFRFRNPSLRWNNGGSKPSLRIAKTATPAKKIGAESEVNSGDFWEDSEFIEVIGVGSRMDAVLNFCLDSPFQSSSLRYWNIISKDPTKVLLQQRSLGNDMSTRNFEASLSLKSSSKTIVLVASAGYGMDHMTAINIFKTIRSASGFTVAIILKPFSFEGQRRQDEVQDLMDTLQGHTSLFIDIDTDKLLKKDLVTLDEAVKTANNAVLLAITAISALKSDMHRKLIGASRNDVKEINILEAFNILERYKEAKIGFGAGYSFKTSILRSIYDCPFLSMGVKDLDGMIICIVASSGVINDDDVDKFVHTFRQTTEYTKEIVVSTIFEPSLEPNLLVTTVLTAGFTGEQASQKSGILIRLAQRFPFISRLWGISNLQSSETRGNNLLEKSTSEVIDSKKETGDRNSVGIIAEVSEKYPGNVQAKMSSNFNESHTSSESEETEAGSFDGIFESNLHTHITKETPFQREPLDSWNEGLGYQIAQKWAKERASEAGAAQMLDKLGTFRLPVGVRSSEELKDSVNISSSTQNSKPKAVDVVKSKRMINKSTTSNEPSDTGLEVVKDFYNATSALLKGKYTDPPKGRGHVSVRAASMLEAERESPKKWNPTVEMEYRGGIFRGRCQGGLPEGKGRLVLGDGSIYDGMWRYGKKSGLGTFYFSNGNVFQGSWRDDVMHGKGWFYFHTGDRWFANFWKGKANGEGRFYSKSGDVIFGHFQDGWRHGEFICIDVDGRRCVENWDQGSLVSRTPLDS